MKPTLVILAAGMASRYGSMKQVESFGPAGETIMDYSIYDAIRAGFGKVVFIIRAQHGETFRSIFEPKLADRIQTEYVYRNWICIPVAMRGYQPGQSLGARLMQCSVPKGWCKSPLR